MKLLPAPSNSSTLVFMATALSGHDQDCKICCCWTEEKAIGLPHLLLTQATRTMPAAFLQLLPTVLEEGEIGMREKTSPLPSPSCTCLHLSLSLRAGGENVSLYPEIWDRNPIPLQPIAKLLIVACKDFIHTLLGGGQVIEHVKCWERRTPRPSAWVLQVEISLSYWNSCA